MTNNNTDLLVNITRKAPWLLEGDQTFFPEKIPGDVKQAIDNIKDYNLTIIAEGGRVFKQYLILRFKENKVLIDKPSEWDNSVTSFHVFFRNKDNIWNFFQVNGSIYDQETITVIKPDSIYLLQKRRFKRALLPIGSKTIFRNDRSLLNSAFVHDISEGGMLIWTRDPRESFQVNSILHEVFISLPNEEDRSDTANTSLRVLPYITKGKITRINTDQSSSISHCGVSFIHENFLLQKRFNSLIAELKTYRPIKSHHRQELDFVTGGQQKISPKGLSC